MKNILRYTTGFAAITLVLPAAADTIYSNLQNLSIPTDFTGVTVTVAGGQINPFFGGVGVANNAALQPARIGTGNLDAILGFGPSVTIDGSQLYSSGFGGSQTHLGNTITAGLETYLGFKLNNTNYGWMRVVFTGNEAGAVIRDWAYDDSGAAIVTGRVQQSAAAGGNQLVTLSPVTGEAYTLGSVITDSGGNVNSVRKTGAGTTVLTVANTYTGITTVTDGTLLVSNTSGSGTGTGTVSVSLGGTLGGTGTIGGAVNVSGILSPGASVETLVSGTLTMNNGSTFQYEVDSSATLATGADLQTVLGDLTLNGTVTLSLDDIATTDTAFADGTTFSLINYTGAWNGGLFTLAGNELSNSEQFVAGLNTWQIAYDAASGGANFSNEYVGGRFVNMTVVPESAAALLGGLGLLTLLRRRRHG
ncbi:MAG: autotransporter-associated beta strand repeat-containing protein [Verrucomicrobia bacterium]|nr:autotransporter-associated beta strand repeat-containing protein [Verrucomicrobiota bacterium]